MAQLFTARWIKYQQKAAQSFLGGEVFWERAELSELR
jgi:hypothetical protein